MRKIQLSAADEPVMIELPGLQAVVVDTRRGIVAVDGISGTPRLPEAIEWRVFDLRDGTYGDFHRLTQADQCNDRDCARSGQHVLDGDDL